MRGQWFREACASSDLLDEIRDLIAAHARPDLRTPIDGLLLSR